MINLLPSTPLPPYFYEGRCPKTGELLSLPRTAQAEAIACDLMQELAADPQYAQEGKMYGVLLAETPAGEQVVLKAFSGLLHRQSTVAGWVPPIPGREQVALAEAQTLAILESLKQQLIDLQNLPERQALAIQSQKFASRLQELTLRHQARKQARQEQRQEYLVTFTGADLALALEPLDEQSRQDGIERRRLKQERDAQLQPLQEAVAAADAQIQELKQQRKAVSRQLQAQMHAAYCLSNFAGESLPLQVLMPQGVMPTGTGDCCAPKLLHYAATQGYKPLAMAEFWWGPNSVNGDKVQGEFYGACQERCQPLMGFLLSGITQDLEPESEQVEHTTQGLSVEIIYEDAWLIVVNKPSGLLSVPGRTRDRQDSVLNRLRQTLPDGMSLIPVHRLDQETSGILVFARDPATHRHLSQQFQQRQVHKQYEAILAGVVEQSQGVIELPLWSDPRDRPRQKVDWQQGKPSVTHFQVIHRVGDYTRLEFRPVTGRTHQLRVHSVHSQGLGMPILGDRLYGCQSVADRLHLHARELQVQHPHSGQTLTLQVPTPF